MKIIECVPNFSAGRDEGFLEAASSVIATVKDVGLLDCSADYDHNRSVFTLVGEPESVLCATIKACNTAVSLIDMEKHVGAHPRIGAVDVVPFIPLGTATMDDAINISHRFGNEFGVFNKIPIYYYGAAAKTESRKRLADIRTGGYEGLPQKLRHSEWLPDDGAMAMNRKSGATAVGARMPLIAFNINLDSNKIEIANKIAVTIREANGGLSGVQAIGVFLASRNVTQVSINVTDYCKTNLKTLFDKVYDEANLVGVAILGSELIGLMPSAAMGASAEYLRIKDFSSAKILDMY